jgi:glycosyltransferase involved in cell wall biosynthesis
LSNETRPRTLWMRSLARRVRPDVTHVNWMPFAGAAAIAGLRPLVAMGWGSDVYVADRRRRLLNGLAAKRADLVLAESAALLEHLHVPRARRSVLNFGVGPELLGALPSDEQKRALRSSLGLGDGPVVVSPRGLKQVYNPWVVLHAFMRISHDMPTAQLVVLDPSEEQLHDGLCVPSDRVHLVGRVPYERVGEFFRAADICVSIPSSDSAPRSVWEAMACGCACVVSDLPWVHERIRSDRDALVVSIDVEDLAHAIGRLLADRKLRDSLAVRGRHLVEEHLQAKAEMDRLEAMYLALARRPVARIK